MDWLDVQLNSFRQRGMQVWLTGHVPPHAGNCPSSSRNLSSLLTVPPVLVADCES
jgi:hypothetical protein